MTNWSRVNGTVERGHRVASGASNDPRFPGGSIALQKPLFQSRGLDLERFFPGTINLSIAPYLFKVKRPPYLFRELHWSPMSPAEDFSFFDCRVLLATGIGQDGLVYYPHPETKPDHFQAPDVLEILTYPVPGLAYGDKLIIELNDDQIRLIGVDPEL